MKISTKVLPRTPHKNKLLILLLFISITGFAQPQLGVKFSPSFVSNRIKIDSDEMSISRDGMGIRPSFGVIAEFPIADMYSFSTGLTYMSKSLKIVANPANNPAYTNRYSIQYIQVPVTIKLFTNEIAIDKRAYFQTGFNIEVQVYNENKTDNPTAIRTFNIIDLPLVFGAGLEMNLGTTTVLFGGIHYQRGLINASFRENFASESFSIKNDLIGVDLGVKF